MKQSKCKTKQLKLTDQVLKAKETRAQLTTDAESEKSKAHYRHYLLKVATKLFKSG